MSKIKNCTKVHFYKTLRPVQQQQIIGRVREVIPQKNCLHVFQADVVRSRVTRRRAATAAGKF